MKLSTLTKLFMITMTSVINKFRDLLFTEVENAAKKEGKSQTSVKITNQHPTILWMLNKCNAFLQGEASPILGEIEKALSKYNQISKDVFKNNTLKDLLLKKEELQEVWQQKYAEITAFFGNQKEAIQQEIDELITLLRHDRIDIQNYPKLNVSWKKFIASVLITGIVFGETFANQQSFLAIPNQSFIQTLWLALAISFGTFAMGALFAKIVRNKNYTRFIKTSIGTAIIAIVLLGYLGISYYRQDVISAIHTAVEGRAGLEISSFTFIVINSLLFFGLIAVKLAIYPSAEVILNNKKHNALKKQIKSKERKIKLLRKQLVLIEEKKKEEKKIIKTEYEKLVVEIDELVAKYYNQLKEQQTSYNQKLANAQCFYQEVDSIAKEAVGLYVHQVGLYQGKINHLDVDSDKIQLKNPFKEYSPITDNEIESIFNPIKPRNYEKSHPFTFSGN